MNSEEILNKKIDQSVYMNFTMNEWKNILIPEADVYVYSTSFIAKRFDSIAFEFCSEREALSILEDNLYALLRFKYFPLQNDDVDHLIGKIVHSCMENIKTLLIKISFEWERNVSNKIIKEIPSSCVAFRNGVYDFKKQEWLFKIYQTPLQTIQNTYFYYNKDYIILWYLDIEFEPLEIDVTKINSQSLFDIFYSTTKDLNNLGFNLIHNMSFNENNEFSLQKFEHLAEILGFTLSSQFIQNFVMFIGSGSNGKNSLLDGCFSSMLIPRPSSISLDTIENDRFVTGALENKYHNFYLETDQKTYMKSEVLKQITGSTLQTIENKGKDKRTGFLNIKHIFSGNHRDDVKFGDSTKGFIRRINLYEVFYEWDSYGDYLKLGNYFPVNLSQDLRELKMNPINTITYIYIGMWGMSKATNKFTTPFYFNHNGYGIKYENIDNNVKNFISKFNLEDLINVILRSDSNYAIFIDKKRIYQHPDFYKTFKLKEEEWKSCINEPEVLVSFLEDKDVWINLNVLKNYSGLILTQTIFNKEVQKYTKIQFQSFYNNQKYAKANLIGRRIKFKK